MRDSFRYFPEYFLNNVVALATCSQILSSIDCRVHWVLLPWQGIVHMADAVNEGPRTVLIRMYTDVVVLAVAAVVQT